MKRKSKNFPFENSKRITKKESGMKTKQKLNLLSHAHAIPNSNVWNMMI